MREWLKGLREAKGLNQSEAAAALGLSRQYYSYIEQGVRLQALPLPLMLKICKVFPVTLNKIAKLEAERIGG